MGLAEQDGALGYITKGEFDTQGTGKWPAEPLPGVGAIPAGQRTRGIIADNPRGLQVKTLLTQPTAFLNP